MKEGGLYMVANDNYHLVQEVALPDGFDFWRDAHRCDHCGRRVDPAQAAQRLTRLMMCPYWACLGARRPAVHPRVLTPFMVCLDAPCCDFCGRRPVLGIAALSSDGFDDIETVVTFCSNEKDNGFWDMIEI